MIHSTQATPLGSLHGFGLPPPFRESSSLHDGEGRKSCRWKKASLQYRPHQLYFTMVAPFGTSWGEGNRGFLILTLICYIKEYFLPRCWR